MRLLRLPSRPGGRAPQSGCCTCQVRGRRSRAARFNWKGTSPSPATTWEWEAEGSPDLSEPGRPWDRAGVRSQPEVRPGGQRRESRLQGREGRVGRERKRGKIREPDTRRGNRQEREPRDPKRSERQREGQKERDGGREKLRHRYWRKKTKDRD